MLSAQPTRLDYLVNSLSRNHDNRRRQVNNNNDDRPCSHHLMLVLKCLHLFPNQSYTLLVHLAASILKHMNERDEFVGLLNEFERSTEVDEDELAKSVKSSPFVMNVFKVRKQWLEARLAETPPVFSWSMPLASMPRHPRVEEFLRSDQAEMRYQLDSVDHVRSFIQLYGSDLSSSGYSDENGYSAQLSELTQPNGTSVLIKKTTKLFEQQMAKFKAYADELNKINSFLESK